MLPGVLRVDTLSVKILRVIEIVIQLRDEI